MDLILFNLEFLILEERFNRKSSDELRGRYYEILANELDDEQFRAACYEIFKNDEFFPSPKRFIEAAPSLEKLLRAEMDRLNLKGFLPPAFQKEGKVTAGCLSPSEKREYLYYLRQAKGADEIRLLTGSNDVSTN